MGATVGTKGGRARGVPAWLVVVIGLLLVLVTAGSGCDKSAAAARWDNTCESLGVCDHKAATATVVDVICDPSVASTCDREHLERTLIVVLARYVERPLSRVRLWVLGESVEVTAQHGEVTALLPKGKNDRARQAERQRWQADALDKLMAGVGPILTAKRPPTSSPIAEAITKVGLADSHGLEREIVVVGDGREMGVWDFECGRLPSDKVWLRRLERRELLQPGSLDGIAVTFSYLTQPPIGRCPVSIKREVRIRELWTEALSNAGAKDIRLLSESVSWDERADTSSGRKHKEE